MVQPLPKRPAVAGERPGLVAGMALILALGIALGLAYNAMGLASGPRGWGLAWITPDRAEQVVSLEALANGTESPGGSVPFTTEATDPMAIAAAPPRHPADLPDIPRLDRPISIELEATKRFFDHGAALFVDAREREEYAAGHIPGAVSLPYDEVGSEPERLEGLESGGRPIIVYCGGGECELSVNLAWDLLFAGHSRVTFYEGGFPEWEEAGYPVSSGEEQGGEG